MIIDNIVSIGMILWIVYVVFKLYRDKEYKSLSIFLIGMIIFVAFLLSHYGHGELP